jgi:RNA polymerase sigma-70 factor (ECF subfamily)
MRRRHVKRLDKLSDRQLLDATTSEDPDAFAIFYRRYEAPVVRFFLRRTRDHELAADLMSETFAAALMSLAGGAGEIRVPAAWLLQIAHSKLIDSVRRGRVEATSRNRLHFEPLALEDDDIARIEQLDHQGHDLIAIAQRELPEDQWEALEARVIEERDYSEIARSLSCSELVVRKRVSRALKTLRVISLREAP